MPDEVSEQVGGLAGSASQHRSRQSASRPAFLPRRTVWRMRFPSFQPPSPRRELPGPAGTTPCIRVGLSRRRVVWPARYLSSARETAGPPRAGWADRPARPASPGTGGGRREFGDQCGRRAPGLQSDAFGCDGAGVVGLGFGVRYCTSPAGGSGSPSWRILRCRSRAYCAARAGVASPPVSVKPAAKRCAGPACCYGTYTAEIDQLIDLNEQETDEAQAAYLAGHEAVRP